MTVMALLMEMIQMYKEPIGILIVMVMEKEMKMQIQPMDVIPPGELGKDGPATTTTVMISDPDNLCELNIDNDNDGVTTTDCDDDDATVYPGAPRSATVFVMIVIRQHRLMQMRLICKPIIVMMMGMD